MARDLNPAEAREPPLVWRRPAPLWTLLALAIGLGLPWAILSGEGGFAQMALLVAGIGFFSALISLAVAGAMGRAPRSRREVTIHVLWLGALTALAAPILFQMLLHAMEGIEAPDGPNGLSGMLPFALWPLALFMGLPLALFTGLTLSFIAFKRGAPDDGVMVLDTDTDPMLADDRDQF